MTQIIRRVKIVMLLSFSGFDISDRKFVQVALGSLFKPVTIHNATDSDWQFFEIAEHHDYLREQEVIINQLCPDILKSI